MSDFINPEHWTNATESRQDSPSQYVFTFRITGKQSIERLEPLLLAFKNEWLQPESLCATKLPSEVGLSRPVDFIWETTCEKDWKFVHQQAKIINRMHNNSIIESKSNLAYLQLLMNCPTLESYVARNTEEAKTWIHSYYRRRSHHLEAMDWWVVKASNGNGGKDIWIVNHENHEAMTAAIPSMNEEYVIQRYVARPLLYQGKYKFHFRCYGFFTAAFQSYLYEKAFILTSGLEFSEDISDQRRHITNLSVNKHFSHHPGQVPCHLPTEYPELFGRIQQIWSELTAAAKRFMLHQEDVSHFEFYGFDVVADVDGRCWLIEVNRLPGLESSKQNLAAEDDLYNEMMTAVLEIVLFPYLQQRVREDSASLSESQREHYLHYYSHPREGYWTNVTALAPPPPDYSSLQPDYSRDTTTNNNTSNLWYQNLFKWKLFTRRHRKQILAFP